MAKPLFNSYVRVVGAEAVNLKLRLAAPRILANNRLLVGDMLKAVKPIVEAETPIGPGHFGYHLRSSYVINVSSAGNKTKGVLKSPAQGYWREYGTSRGERALMVAHKAANTVRRFIRAYYGGMATWWRL